MCPQCRAFITTSDRVCPYCEERVGPRIVEERNPAAIMGLIPAAKFTTSVIILLNVAIYIASQINEALVQVGDKNSYLVLQQHEWYRLITAGFLHGGLLHIGMNMWVLNDLGGEVERTYGTARFLVIYFVSTVCGFLLSSYMSLHPSLGASAGILGLIGAMIAFGLRNRTQVGRDIRAQYVKWAIYALAFGLLGIFSVDNWAHIGGVAGGLAVAYVAGTPVHSSRAMEQCWKALATVAVLLTAFSFWQMYMQFTASAPPMTISPV